MSSGGQTAASRRRRWKTRLRTVVSDARVDDHAAWLADLAHLVRSLAALAGLMIALTGLALVIAIALICRAVMATERDTIELLHVMGAGDGSIARHFQSHAWRLAWPAALAGFLLAVISLGFLLFFIRHVVDLSTLQFSRWIGLVLLMIVVPCAAVMAAALSARSFGSPSSADVPMMRLMRCLILIAGILSLVWLWGLVGFVQSIETVETEPAIAAPTDVIVVLTGGSERVSTGLELLAAHKAGKLFISGVHPGLSLDKVLGSQPVAKDLRDCCISLGHAAETTFGNAWETRAWMESHNYRSLRLVTANYHMPRSLAIFRTVMPEFEIIPHPVIPENVKLGDWWQRPGTASLLVTEYNKYLLAYLRLWIGSA